MKRLALSLACPTCVLSLACFTGAGMALGQQPVQVQARCIPADPVFADVRSGAASMQEVFRDADGDIWVVVRLKADGAAAIGWINVAQRQFCIVAGGAPPAREDNPGRGV